MLNKFKNLSNNLKVFYSNFWEFNTRNYIGYFLEWKNMLVEYVSGKIFVLN